MADVPCRLLLPTIDPLWRIAQANAVRHGTHRPEVSFLQAPDPARERKRTMPSYRIYAYGLASHLTNESSKPRRQMHVLLGRSVRNFLLLRGDITAILKATAGVA